MLSTDKNTAECLFKQAFERLKQNKSIVLPKGTPVTQNNVAREAGRDPSALKKDRYPILVLEIQAFIALQGAEKKNELRNNDNRSRTIKQRLDDCQRQRDKLSSIVAAQNSYIEELQDEIERLKVGKVLNL